MKKQFVLPWAYMYKVNRRHVIATSGELLGSAQNTMGDEATISYGGFAPTRTASLGSTPTVIYGDDYE